MSSVIEKIFFNLYIKSVNKLQSSHLLALWLNLSEKKMNVMVVSNLGDFHEY